mgnify:FL=1
MSNNYRTDLVRGNDHTNGGQQITSHDLLHGYLYNDMNIILIEWLVGLV